MFLDELPASLATILSNVTSFSLECFLVDLICFGDGIKPIDSIPAALTGLKDVDAVLSRPQFHSIRFMQINLGFNLMKRGDLRTFNTYLCASSSIAVLAPLSISQPGLIDSAGPDNPFRKPPVSRFEPSTERLIKDKILEELKQFASRAILDINLKVYIMEQAPKAKATAEVSRNAEDNVSNPSSSANGH